MPGIDLAWSRRYQEGLCVCFGDVGDGSRGYRGDVKPQRKQLGGAVVRGIAIRPSQTFRKVAPRWPIAPVRYQIFGVQGSREPVPPVGVTKLSLQKIIVQPEC